MSLTNSPWAGICNSVMTSLFPPRESLIVTSWLGPGNSRTFFYGVGTTIGYIMNTYPENIYILGKVKELRNCCKFIQEQSSGQVNPSKAREWDNPLWDNPIVRGQLG
jgi:hypothetical protein